MQAAAAQHASSPQIPGAPASSSTEAELRWRENRLFADVACCCCLQECRGASSIQACAEDTTNIGGLRYPGMSAAFSMMHNGIGRVDCLLRGAGVRRHPPQMRPTHLSSSHLDLSACISSTHSTGLPGTCLLWHARVRRRAPQVRPPHNELVAASVQRRLGISVARLNIC